MTKPVTLEELDKWDAEVFDLEGEAYAIGDDPEGYRPWKRLGSSYRLALAVVEATRQGQYPNGYTKTIRTKINDALAAFDKGTPQELSS